jgi:hypothetical protein
MKQRFRNKTGIAVLSAAIIGLATVAAAHDTTSAADWKPASPPSVYVAGPGATNRDDYFDSVCTTNTQLDCTESVAAYINNEWVAGTLTGRTESGPSGVCCLEWKIPGLRNEDSTDLIMTRNLIKYTGNVFNSVQIHATTKDGFRVAWESGSTACTTNKVNGVCYREGNLQEGVKFRMIIRSSWVLPTAVSAGLTDMKTTIQYLPQSGATKVTFEGIPTYTMGVSSDTEPGAVSTGVFTDPNGKGSWGMLLFDASTVDGRFYPIKKECNEKPTIVTGANGYGMSIPSFANGQLDLKVQAPHFRPDGKTVHTGLYEAVVPLVTAECLWGKAINSADQIKIEVFETASGETKTATSSIAISGDNLLIRASGFSYSIPTIRVKLADATTTTSSSTTTPPAATTPAPASPVYAPVVSAPRNVKVTALRQIVKTTFTKASGVSYSATAKKGKTTARLACKTVKQKVTCTSKRLARGSWVLTVSPTKNGIKGTPARRTIKVS